MQDLSVRKRLGKACILLVRLDPRGKAEHTVSICVLTDRAANSVLLLSLIALVPTASLSTHV